MAPLRLAAALAIAGACLVSCHGTKPEAPRAAGAPAPAGRAKPAATQAPQPQPQPVPPPVPVFVYNPTGLRDPFEPFIKIEDKKKPAVPKASLSKTPLQQFATEELKVVGVLWGDAAKPSALIEDPKGKGYVVGIGTHVGDRGGKIVRIQPDRVVIEERFTDLFGEERVNVATMTLHKTEGEVSR